MMRPTFEQVLDYLRSGEENPEIEEMLKHDPDGRTKLREAEMMLTLLRGGADPIDADDDADALVTSVQEVASMESSMVTEGPLALKRRSETFKAGSPGETSEEVFRTADLVRDAAGSMHKMGTLSVQIESGAVEVTYQQPAVHRLPSKTKESTKTRRPTLQRWPTISGFEVSLQVLERPSDTEYLRFRLTQYRHFHRGEPLRAQELIFMPESGPFSRVSTNSKGIAALPMPEQSGILRLETDTPHQLYIHLKK